MAARQSSLTDIDVFSFSTSFESIFSLMLNVDLYVFNGEGVLIDHQPIWRGIASVPMSEDELSGAHIFVGPAGSGAERKLATLGDMEDARYCEVGIEFHPGQRHYQLTAVPENVWRWWLVDEVWRREEN